MSQSNKKNLNKRIDCKEFTQKNITSIVSNKGPYFLWRSLQKGITTTSLDILLGTDDSLRKQIKQHIDQSSFSSYLFRIGKTMDPCPNLNQTYDGDDVFLSTSSLIVGKVL